MGYINKDQVDWSLCKQRIGNYMLAWGGGGVMDAPNVFF